MSNTEIANTELDAVVGLSIKEAGVKLAHLHLNVWGFPIGCPKSKGYPNGTVILYYKGDEMKVGKESRD